MIASDALSGFTTTDIKWEVRGRGKGAEGVINAGTLETVPVVGVVAEPKQRDTVLEMSATTALDETDVYFEGQVISPKGNQLSLNDALIFYGFEHTVKHVRYRVEGNFTKATCERISRRALTPKNEANGLAWGQR